MAMQDDEDDEKTFDLEDIEEEVEVEDPEVEAEPEEEETPPPKKGNPVYGELRQAKREARELREQLARQGGQIETLTRTVSTPRVDPREEQDRIAAMSDREYADYMRNRQDSELRGAFGSIQFQQQDLADQRSYDRLCRSNKVFDDIADEVEDRLNDMRKQGQTTSRKAMAHQILGEKTAAKALRVKKKDVEETVRRPVRTGAGSDVPNNTRQARTQKGKSARDRLEGIKF